MAIEIGLTYILDPNSFSDTDPSNYPFDPNNVQHTLFFILEEDSAGADIYDAIGVVQAIPLPASIWFLGSALLICLNMVKRPNK